MQQLLNIFGITLSLLTATGVFVHDARIDRATAAPLTTVAKKAAAKFSFGDLGLAGGDHTHPEHGARTLKGFTYKTPSYPPREMRMKRYMTQNIEPRGRHAFDNHHLPFLEEPSRVHRAVMPAHPAHERARQHVPSLARAAGVFLLLGVAVP